jgi:recombination protein RecA
MLNFAILSSGFPSGTIGIVSGPPKGGKTTTVLTICANAQKPENGGKKIYYIDVECRLDAKTLSGIHGLDVSPEKFQIIRSKEGHIYTAEDFLDEAERLLKAEPNIVVVIDSTSSLCSLSESTSEITSQFRSPTGKLLATFSRKIAGTVPAQDSMVIYITHVIANTSGYGSPWMADSGQKIQFACHIKLLLKGYSKWLEGENQIGQIIKYDIVYSALGAPGATVESYLRYGYGIDDIYENIEIATDCGIIEKGGAWFTINCVSPPVKLQGQHKLREYMVSNKDVYDVIVNKIKEFGL